MPRPARWPQPRPVPTSRYSYRRVRSPCTRCLPSSFAFHLALRRRAGCARAKARLCSDCATVKGNGSAGLRDERWVVVLGAEQFHVVEPAALIDVSAALAHGVFEVPGIALVRPVLGRETVRLAPMTNGRVMVAGVVQEGSQLEVRGGGCLRLVARMRPRD